MVARADRPKVVVTCKQMQVALPSHLQELEDAGVEVIVPQLDAQQFDEGELTEMLPGVDAIIAGDDLLTRRVLEASDLRVLIKWGIGTDSIDLPAAADLGIVVRNTPGVFGDEVADSAFAYILLLARGHHLVDAAVRRGEWPKVQGKSLRSATLGVIGYGAIGRSIAQRGLGFGMDVLAYDPFVSDSGDPSIVMTNLDGLLAAADFVILACPLTEDTRHLINAETLALMRPDGYLVNVGRGPLVDEPALVEALASRRIAGAGLDVFEVEPLPQDSPLRGMDDVILGAHNGSNTEQGVVRASARAVELLIEELGALDEEGTT